MTLCLIVDDSSTVRKAIRYIVQDFSFTIEEAEDGEKALEKCHISMPDVILLDWNMPVMNGMEFLKAIRSEPGGSRPKIIFCTTENEFSRIQEAIVNGADEYVMKPFDKNIIREKLEQVGII
ncbi:MAG: response regulator [Holosporales bacterium]